MSNLFFERFIKREKEKALKYSDVPLDIIEKYKNVFVAKRDEEFDFISEIWKRQGFCSYQNGLFSLINPDEYNELARNFSSVSDNAIAFARTGIGCLFLWDKLKIGESIIYLNVHKNEINIVGTSFIVFFGISVGADNWWKDECYGKVELKANKKYEQMESDECYTFIPALALGGDEKISNLQKVKIKENLEFLSQL